MVPSGHVATPPAFVRLAAQPLRWALLAALADSDYRVRELVALVGQPQNLVSYHLRLLRAGGLVTVIRSSFDGRDSYYHLDLDRCAEALAATGAALHPALRPDAASPVAPAGRPRCATCRGAVRVHRQQRPFADCRGAAAPPRRRPRERGECRHPAQARTAPQRRAGPADQFGIDITGQQPRHIDTLAGRRFDHVITLCDKARETCPPFTHHPRRVHWSVPDPAALGGTDRDSYPAFQHAAADIDTRIQHLLPVLTRPTTEEVPP